MKKYLSILALISLLSCHWSKSSESEVKLLSIENDLLYNQAKGSYDNQQKKSYHYYWFSEKAFKSGVASQNLKKLYTTGLEPDSVTVNGKKFTWVTLGNDISLYKDVFSDAIFVDSCVVDGDCSIDIFIR
jgi:hypothetical protein